LKFDAKSANGLSKDAFKALQPRGPGTFEKLETGHAGTFELKPDEDGQRDLRDRKGGRGNPDCHRAG
jgi:hypothetical protein